MHLGRVAMVLLVVGCANASDTYPDNPRTMVGGERPTEVHVPENYAPTRSWPLVVVLHGYGSTGQEHLAYSGFERLVNEEGLLVVAPDGTVDKAGKRFWNATDFCCDLNGLDPDDAGYLNALIYEIRAEYNVDPSSIFLWGHSNGAFMSHRMACDHADTIRGVVTLAGSMWLDPSRCDPSKPVSVLQIHGTSDNLVFYEGLELQEMGFPGAEEVVARWAAADGCSTSPTTEGRFDLDTSIEGDETERIRFSDCNPGTGVELWKINEGDHDPEFSSIFADQVWQSLAVGSR